MPPKATLATWLNRVAANPFQMFSKNVATQKYVRPMHKRVRFNKQVYVAEAVSVELGPWIDDLGQGSQSCCLAGEGDDEEEEEEEERDIAELLAEANISEERNTLVRRRQLTRGNRYGSKLTREQGELCLVDADDNACPVNSRISEELEVYCEPLNLNGGKPRRVNRCLSAQDAQEETILYETGPILPMIPTFDQLLVDFEALGESDGPATPPDEVVLPVFSIGLGLPSVLAGRRPTPRKVGSSRLPSAENTPPEHQASTAYAKGVSRTDKPLTYGIDTAPRRMPSTLAARSPTSRVRTQRLQRMEDSDS
ncbi:hypothetical protein BDY19DRAFT_1060951 [Irpex rosettiformis]|uniref:Uncharacterized protein n=1 Tax=Irpex rosettiformis TaxID=378272 RepID=A0ACB8TN82_9APHY|nr:hypothetical protein BDY19DRAFT_1060951 [Irpex rosettiformis]